MSVTAAELFDRHAFAVFRFFRRITRRAELAEDLTQEVFLRVVRSLPAYQGAGRESAWVFRIAHHVLADHGPLSEAARGIVIPLDEAVNEPHDEPSHVAAISFYEAVGLLPREEREVFLLRELGGLTYAELAKDLETTEEAVRSKLYRARRQIKRVLSGRLVPADLRQREGE